MEKEQKIEIARIIAGAVLFGASFIPAPAAVSTALKLAAFAAAGYEVLWNAVKNIFRGQVFDENFLMSIATVGAIAVGEYSEAVVVMLFYGIGELFQDIAVDKSRASIASLMDIRPDHANVETETGLSEVAPEDVPVGSVIIVKPGERIPLDGAVIEGASSVNTSALTGESAPRDVTAGDRVISGCLNMTGLLRVRTSGEYGESTVKKILDLVENSQSGKAKSERFITRFAKIYTPAVVAGAAALVLIPTLLGGEFTVWLRRALTFLVISCPCALVISVPLGFFAGIGAASRRGVLIKGSNYLEALSNAKTVVFDKTGTLTKGSFAVAAVHPEIISENELLLLAAAAESYSDHPISVSIRNACKQAADAKQVSDVRDMPGLGISAVVGGKTVLAGNDRLMDSVGAKWRPCHCVGTLIHVAVNGEYMGHIVISDEVKPTSAEAIAQLKRAGVEKTVMLTGDRADVAASVAAAIGIDECRASLLPADKVAEVEKLLSDKKGGTLVFVGDGVNDAPVLKRADVGIAMGALGSDAAIEAADVVLMDDDPAKIPYAVSLARRTLRIVKQNIVFALAVKGAILLLGALGMASMWGAVFADVGVSFIAILNSLRAMRIK